MKKIYVAIPAYTGAIAVETASSLMREIYHGMKNGFAFVPEFVPYNPMIHYVRNALCRMFLEGEYTDIIFLDSDVGFEQGTLCKLAAHPVDIVGAIYPHRADALSFPIRYISERTELCGGTEPGTENILEVEGIPAGCMRISRHALEVIAAKFPQNVYHDMTGLLTHSYFEFSKERGGFNGEDWHFCQVARDAGLKVWCDPDIDMTHTGTKVFHGNLGKHLRGRSTLTIDDQMRNIMQFAGVEETA